MVVRSRKRPLSRLKRKKNNVMVMFVCMNAVKFLNSTYELACTAKAVYISNMGEVLAE